VLYSGCFMTFPIPLGTWLTNKKAELLRSAGRVGYDFLHRREEFRIIVRRRKDKVIVFRSDVYEEFSHGQTLFISMAQIQSPSYGFEVLISFEKFAPLQSCVQLERVPYRNSERGRKRSSTREGIVVSFDTAHFQLAFQKAREGAVRQLMRLKPLQLRRGYGPSKP